MGEGVEREEAVDVSALSSPISHVFFPLEVWGFHVGKGGFFSEKGETHA